MISGTPKLSTIKTPSDTTSGVIRQKIVSPIDSGSGGITQDAADARYMPIDPASGNGLLARIAGVWTFLTGLVSRTNGSGLISAGWMKVGRISASGPMLIDIRMSMIRDNTGKGIPSQYRLSISANVDGGVATCCYFGAQLSCLYGTDYDGVNDDPLLSVALVRPSGASAHTADILIRRNGTGYRLLMDTDMDAPIAWSGPTEVSDPGTGDNVSIALRRIIVAT